MAPIVRVGKYAAANNPYCIVRFCNPALTRSNVGLVLSSRSLGGRPVSDGEMEPSVWRSLQVELRGGLANQGNNRVFKLSPGDG